MDDHSRAGELLPDYLSGLIDKDVEGWVEPMSRNQHDCPSDPVGLVKRFRATDDSIVIRWCEECEWHSVEERPVS